MSNGNQQHNRSTSETQVSTHLYPDEFVFAEMPDFTDDNQGLFDRSGEVGLVITHDNSQEERELTTLQWIQIAARHAGGSARVSAKGELTEAAREHNKLLSERQRDSYSHVRGRKYAVVVARISEKQLLRTLLHFDPKENKSQI